MRAFLSLSLILGVGLLGLAEVGSAQKHHHQKLTSDFAKSLHTCVQNPTKNLDQCLAETLEQLRSLMPRGIPELGLRRTEPLEIQNIFFREDKKIVSIDATFSNVVVEGLSKFITNHISANVDRRIMSLSLTVPRVNITGIYNVNGKVFVFPVKGNGGFNTTLHNVRGTGTARILPVGHVGDQKLSVRDANINFEIGGANVHMDNLFDGALPEMANAVNGFLSDNSVAIVDEIKPQIRMRMESMVERVMNDAFSQIPSDQFIREIHQQKKSSGRHLGPLPYSRARQR